MELCRVAFNLGIAGRCCCAIGISAGVLCFAKEYVILVICLDLFLQELPWLDNYCWCFTGCCKEDCRLACTGVGSYRGFFKVGEFGENLALARIHLFEREGRGCRDKVWLRMLGVEG